MIKPSVGRVVLFHPSAYFAVARAAPGEPLPALVARVWSDTMINVGGFDANGGTFAASSVRLCQTDEDVAQAKSEGISYAEWMPYQKGQAAKTEAVEKQLSDVGSMGVMWDGNSGPA